jgi:capsular exopolysaccharide synthesis family protein
MQNLNEYLEVVSDPRSQIAESFRSLRATLQLSLGKGLRSLVVLSCWVGDGKSSVSANLAASLSQLFIKTVIIDGDLRRPTLTRLFEVADKPGLSDVLLNRCSVEEAILPTHIKNLGFMPAGTCLEDAADLLGRGQLAGILASLAELDYFTIIDSPPLSVCRDSLLFCSNADAAILVATAKQWVGEPETRYKQILEGTNVQLLGVVINGVKPTHQSYGGSNSYGYGYGYGKGGSELGYNPGAADESDRAGNLAAKERSWWKKMNPFR